MTEPPGAAAAGTASPPTTPARRWILRLFWGWQILYALLVGMVLTGLVLEELRVGMGEVVQVLAVPVHLAPLLGPAWLPVTTVLGLLLLLSRPRRPAAPGAAR